MGDQCGYSIYESFGQHYIDFGSTEIVGPFDTKYSAFKYLERKGIIDD